MRRETRNNKLWRGIILLVLFFISVEVLSACAGAATQAPAAPVEPEEGHPVQYGQDTRLEPFQHSDEKLKEMAASVAVFVYKNQVHVSGNSVSLDAYTLNEMSEMGWLVPGENLPMCADELFTSQPAPGFCTGFLVGEDMLVTAGHCLQKATCADTSIVFGFQMESSDALAKISKEDVFNCAEVLLQALPDQQNHFLDYAILKLDRPTGRGGLTYSAEDRLKAQDQVAVLGYPSGLPLKIASNSIVMSNDAGNPFFVANLDTFGSNSGSPVINMATYQVEGILVRGTSDYIISQDAACVQVNRCPEGGDASCAGENATKMAELAQTVSTSLSGEDRNLNCLPGLTVALILISLSRLKISL